MDPYVFEPLISTGLPIAASAGTAIYAYFANRSRAAAKEITDLRAEVDALEKRVDKLETEMQHLPDKDMVSDLRLAIAKLEGTVSTLGEKVSGVARTVGVIDDVLRKGAA
ncbi:DUF2730 family protein [Devosia sp.]|jgi:cell division protein FtsB|uniref:DUF2730 family protein n=1 Tax=Devosia sp. TaxID=1871048 RepID=UPI0037C082F0